MMTEQEKADVLAALHAAIAYVESGGQLKAIVRSPKLWGGADSISAAMTEMAAELEENQRDAADYGWDEDTGRLAYGVFVPLEVVDEVRLGPVDGEDDLEGGEYVARSWLGADAKIVPFDPVAAWHEGKLPTHLVDDGFNTCWTLEPGLGDILGSVAHKEQLFPGDKNGGWVWQAGGKWGTASSYDDAKAQVQDYLKQVSHKQP